MCYVIFTSRAFLWTVLTIAATFSTAVGLISPIWLLDMSTIELHIMDGNHSLENVISLGIINKCSAFYSTRMLNLLYQCREYSTANLYHPEDEMPPSWKATAIFLALGLFFMAFTVVSSLLSYCCRSIRRKSIFTISGTVQSVAGLFYIIGLFAYPIGWNAELVSQMCGKDVRPFMLGNCTFGWSFYLTAVGALLTFICSVLSIQADSSTSSDKVQDEISLGKSFVCLM